jgi:hypothetical protein
MFQAYYASIFSYFIKYYFFPWTGFWFYALHSNSLTFPNQYKDSSLQCCYTMLTNGLPGNNLPNDRSHTAEDLIFSNFTVTSSNLASPITGNNTKLHNQSHLKTYKRNIKICVTVEYISLSFLTFTTWPCNTEA